MDIVPGELRASRAGRFVCGRRVECIGTYARIGITFFGGLLGLGLWDGMWQFGRLLRNLAHGTGNLVARRPFNPGMESVGLDSIVDTLKVFGIALAFIAGAAGLVIVAAGGAFGGAGSLIRR